MKSRNEKVRIQVSEQRNQSSLGFDASPKPSVTKVQRLNRFQSASKQPMGIIHISLRPKTTNNQVSPQPYPVEISPVENDSSVGIMASIHDCSLMRPDDITTSLQQKNLTQDHHRASNEKKQKNKCMKKYLLLTLALILTIVVILSIVLSLVLIKSSTNITTKNATLRWNPIGITVAGIAAVGGNGSNQLNDPRGVVWVSPNQLYVADYENHRIQKFLIGDLTGITVAGKTSAVGSNASDRLSNPTRVLIDSNGALYIADSSNHRIQFWSKGATFGTTVAGSATGVPGSSMSLFNIPIGLVLDESSNTLYVADYNNDRIMKYNVGNPNGMLVAGGHSFGWNETQLYRPYGLYFDTPTNSLIIANSNAQNIVRWTLGASNWTLLAGSFNGSLAYQTTPLAYPMDAIMDPLGNLYIADRNQHRIQFITAGSTTATTIAGVTSTFGSNATHLYRPRGLCLDHQLNLYVADSQNDRIQMFLRY